MRVPDNRLDRTVIEQVGVTSSFTEDELEELPAMEFPDRDYDMISDKIESVVSKLQDDWTSRQAIVTTDTEACIVGVQVLVRDYLHVLAWLRSSDVVEYRDNDVAYLYNFGNEIRDRIDYEHRPIMVHIFTSSLHQEVS